MDAQNPATGEVIATYERDDDAAIERALTTATKTYETWRTRPLREREQLLPEVAAILRERTDEYAELMTTEMGKPIKQARAEVEKCAWLADHYATHASSYLEPDHHPSPPGTTVKTVYDPIGPVLAVMPWNFPFWQVFRFAVPYLTAGNVGLLKHASNVPGAARAIEEIFRDAGYPAGAFQTLLIGADDVEQVLTDDRVKAATLTGSGPAGRAVASTAGDELKKTVLELGGSDPFIVLADADLDAAAETGAWARNQNGGQSCIAAKRFIVVEDVYEPFVDRLIDAFADLTVGDPLDPDTDVGPQVSPAARDRLHEQVQASRDAGATVELGGEPLDRDGAYYPPTILTDVPPGCPVDSEEVFGPAAAVYRVPDTEAAIEKANDTPFGLGASLWTNDVTRGAALAREIDAGGVYINELVKSDPRVPFGGIGTSGYGRELSEIGIKEFTNRKTVWLTGTDSSGTTDS